MPTSIDAQPYLAAARCTFCNIPAGLIYYSILAALIDVSNGDPVPTDSNELLNEARCLQSCIPAGLLPYAILAAVGDIEGGGGAGGDCCPAGVGSPEGVVTAEPGASYLDTSTDEFWLKRTGSGNVGWFLKVA